MPSLLRSLKHRSFALLWAGQTISRVGDFVYQIALAWWVLQKTGSATVMGMVLVFGFTPMILFLLLGGVVVDRFPRVRLMLLSDLGRAALAAAVAWLAVTGRLEVWHVFVAAFLFGFADAFFQPAYIALVPELVPEADLISANSLTSMSMQAGRIVGPASGAGIVALGGTPLAFGLNAVSFVAAGLLLLPLLAFAEPPRAPSEHRSMWADLREGFGLVRRTPWLWLTILNSAFGNIGLAGPYSVAMPFLIKESMHQDVGTLGLLYSIFPIGYLLGGLWLGRQAKIHHRGLLAYGGIITAGVCMAAFALPLAVAALAVLALINGAALEVFGLIWTTTMQELVPGEMLGRVASIDQVGSFALLPIGLGVAGWATDAFGAPATFALGGLSTALLALAGLAHPAVRGLD